MADWYAGLDLGQQGDFTALALLERVELPKGEPRIVRTERPVEIPEELQRMSKMGPVERAMKGLDNTEYQAVFGVAPPWPTVVEERTVQDDGRTELHVRHVQRWPLGTSYPAIVARVREILDTPQLRGRTTLVLDATGVGRPVLNLFEEAPPAPLVPVTITGGDSANTDGYEHHVPKRDLATSVMVLLQNERLKIVGSLALAGVLKAELRNFTVKINLRGHASFEAGAAAGDLWREGAHDDLILAVALGCWYAEHGTPAAPSIWSPWDE